MSTTSSEKYASELTIAYGQLRGEAEVARTRRARSRQRAFWSNVQTGKADECWPWKGRVDQNGYGRWGSHTAPSVAYTMIHGPLPKGKEAGHSCNNRLCCNPRDISAMTHIENMQQCARQMRGGNTRGEKNGRAKLNFEKASDMRKLSSEGHSRSVLAKMFDVCLSQVDRVLGGKIWNEDT